jgi:hypothetical protein
MRILWLATCLVVLMGLALTVTPVIVALLVYAITAGVSI